VVNPRVTAVDEATSLLAAIACRRCLEVLAHEATNVRSRGAGVALVLGARQLLGRTAMCRRHMLDRWPIRRARDMSRSAPSTPPAATQYRRVGFPFFLHGGLLVLGKASGPCARALSAYAHALGGCLFRSSTTLLDHRGHCPELGQTAVARTRRRHGPLCVDPGKELAAPSRSPGAQAGGQHLGRWRGTPLC